MKPDVSLVDQILIPEPCPAPWGEMSGDRLKRHCGRCDCDVVHLSEMTRAHAERLLKGPDAPRCVQVYRDRQNRVITADRPLALVRARWLGRLAGIAARVGFMAGLGAIGAVLQGCALGGKICLPEDEMQGQSQQPDATDDISAEVPG